MYLSRFPERVSAREMSRSLKGIQDISTDFFVGTEVSENDRLLMKMLIQDTQKTEQLSNRVFTNVWICMFPSGVN